MPGQGGESPARRISDPSAMMGQCEQQALALLVKQRLKALQPQYYEGSPDLATFQTFCFDCRRYLRQFSTLSEDDRVQQASLFLTGEAKIFYRCLEETGSLGERPKTLEEFFDVLRRRFISQNSQWDILQELAELQMIPGQPQQYIARFQKLLVRAPELSETMKRFFFFRGLDKQTRDALITVESVPLPDLFRMVERFAQAQTRPVSFTAPTERRPQEEITANDFAEAMDVSETFAVAAQRREQYGRRPPGPRRNDVRRPRQQRPSRRESSGQGSGFRCYYCKKEGHSYNACRSLRRDLLEGRITVAAAETDKSTESGNDALHQ